MRYALITDSNVQALYGKAFRGVDQFSFPAGEGSKTRATKEKLEDQLIEAGYGRETVIIALGGGVVTDLAGFLASTFCRGVPLVLIPTTLMAMVDAVIGGKTGVNTELGKNMIGSLYFPQSIIIDLNFLKTLPEKEIFNGKVEMLKAGLMADRDYFEQFDGIALETSIDKAIEIKRRIIARDLSETGLRRILNLGHTIGHALETVSNYALSHGEAVAMGIVLEARMSYEMGILKASALDQIAKCFPPVSLAYNPDAIIEALGRDKKGVGGKPRFVLLREIGEPIEADGEYCLEVAPELIKKVLNDAAVCPC